MNSAAFKAEYSDWKLIRTRKCVQIVFELPLEAADAAYQVLGGMPDPSTSVWFGIAKLQPTSTEGGGHEEVATPSPRQETKTGGARSWDAMTAAQQAGILCADKAFQKFAGERWFDPTVAQTEQLAVDFVRDQCQVTSRAHIDVHPTAKIVWEGLVKDFRFWQQHPELVG